MESNLRILENYLDEKVYKVYYRAEKYSYQIISKTQKYIKEYFDMNKINLENVCFVAIGSVGRREALESSDLDLIPVFLDSKIEKKLKKKFREFLSNKLDIKLSSGDDLTKPISLKELTKIENIGGVKDSNSLLTKRILILTEGIQVGGQFSIDEVKKKIISAYKDYTITSGRYVLTLCNDIARYYRTLIIDYKAKIDVENKDWCTRNVKLRHSRKIWYFSNLLTLVSLAYEKNDELENYSSDLIKEFSLPPIIRIFKNLDEHQIILGKKLLKYYSWYLDYFSESKNRKKLSKIEYEKRYDFFDENPYHFLKASSDIIHQVIIELLESLDYKKRQKILDWFLL